MSPDMQFNTQDRPLEKAEQLLVEALRLLDAEQAQLAAAYAATAIDALARHRASKHGNLH